MPDENIPHEPTAEERAASIRREDIVAAEAYNKQTQEALSLLAMAVHQLGGVMVIPAEDLYQKFSIGIDYAFHRETGGMRVYAYPRQES